MLNLKAPRATTLAACAALALAGMGASADAATTNGGFETAAADGGHVAAGWLTAPTGNPVQWSADAHTSLLLAGLATVGAIARRRRA